jgi:hypothetical protein
LVREILAGAQQKLRVLCGPTKSVRQARNIVIIKENLCPGQTILSVDNELNQSVVPMKRFATRKVIQAAGVRRVDR